MATSIDDNEADEKSDKPRCQLINIRCTSTASLTFRQMTCLKINDTVLQCSIQSGIGFWSCIVRARQNFDGSAVALSRETLIKSSFP